MLYLYLIEGDPIEHYDVFSSAVVVAASEEDAKRIHPRGGPNPRPQIYEPEGEQPWFIKPPENVFDACTGYADDDSWVAPEMVRASNIGIASSELQAGTVICASFFPRRKRYV